MDHTQNRKILVTGATGYVGGRLITRLVDAGYPVRAMARDPGRLAGRSWSEAIEIVQADVTKPETLEAALNGIDVAYYLIHSMAGNADFHERDILAAHNFGQAAKGAGVQRIIYLGGIGDEQSDLSEHLRSRQETGHALAECGIPVTEFRSAVVVGSGSLSFEMVRYLTERLPVMIGPRWVYNRIQPISIRNVLDYLTAALDVPESAGQIIEIGGADIQTYASMMLTYAKVRGLRRVLIPVPVLTPTLSSHWVHWMTPVNASLARPLIEGVRNETIVHDDKALQLFPHIAPMTYQEAVSRALEKLDLGMVETSWSDAIGLTNRSVLLETQEGMIRERRELEVSASAADVFRVVRTLGGNKGWPTHNWAWKIRGLMDRLIGGSGLRRGRRDPDNLRVGDALDFWRVEQIEPDQTLRLRAEMIVPGRAWLQFEVHALSETQSRLVQTAFFAPRGLFGLLYWYGLYPIHSLIFSAMIRKMGEEASQ